MLEGAKITFIKEILWIMYDLTKNFYGISFKGSLRRLKVIAHLKKSMDFFEIHRLLPDIFLGQFGDGSNIKIKVSKEFFHYQISGVRVKWRF